jgi:hypothetical protein
MTDIAKNWPVIGLADPEARLTALHVYACSRLAAYKVPEPILVSPAPLPRNGSGKLLKSARKSMFA